MSKLHHDSDQLRVELMKKFRDGTLSAEEEAYLEALKAQDPFVADALEGTSVLKDGERFGHGVDELQARILERTKAAKRQKIYWLPIAASVALLIGTFYAVYTVLLPADTPSLSSQETIPTTNAPEESTKMEQELTPISLLPPEGLEDSQQLQDEELPQTLALVPSETSAFSAENSVEDSFNASTASDSGMDNVSQTLSEVESKAFDENFTLSGRAKTNDEYSKGEALTNQIRSSKKLSSAAPQITQEGWKTVSGRVIDQESKDPIPGVNVLVKETTVGSITDVEGRFVIDLPKDNNNLVISSIGYQTTEVNVDQQDSVAVALAHDIQSLSEVVTMGYGSERSRDEVVVTSAKPLNGMRAYRKYLNENQKYPDEWKEGDKAVVKLSFTVFPDGKLSDIMVEQSAGDWLDQEAIRLIQDGPDWEPATRNGEAIAQEVKLRVRFKK
ncbi:TonB family protein [Catalinimonas sp. 4WD22]|uniref:energy transducer TonB n=1 Tax=Catalinimonas locisalis TaxID=3133978 RepID=UPI003101B087